MKRGIFLLFVCFFSLSVYSQDSSWPVLKHYDANHLYKISLPLGGIGTGTVSLGGRGELRDWAIMNIPGVNFNGGSEPNDAPFFAIYVKEEGKEPVSKGLMGPLYPYEYDHFEGKPANNYGLPRFDSASFDAAYPFGRVNLSDDDLPVKVKILGFNPLIPGDAEASGLPVAVLYYEVTNTSDKNLEVAVCGNIRNFIGYDGDRKKSEWRNGRIRCNSNEFRQENNLSGIFMYSDSVPKTDQAWGTMALLTSETEDVSFRRSSTENRWGNALLNYWDDFSADGELTDLPEIHDWNPMASLSVKKSIGPHSKKVFKFYITWNFPNRFAWSDKRVGNYYSLKYSDAWDAALKIIPQIPLLEEKTRLFVNTFLQSDYAPEVKEAALFNLSVLRSQTVFRIGSGHMMAWEGIFDNLGLCQGSCTHVWNYEQATAFLFGELAKTMRDVEFNHSTNENGLMSFRANLPLDSLPTGLAAADGQMGCIMKMYRDWQLSGDNDFLKQHWPKVKKAMQFAWIPGGWDANIDGVMEGCQHNTMDVEYFGPNPQMQFWYLGALKAAGKMAGFMEDIEFQKQCEKLFRQGSAWTDANLFNGEYYVQKIIPPLSADSIAKGLMYGLGTKNLEEPDFQLGEGCLVDQLVGQYMAHICGLGYLADSSKIVTTLQSILKYNHLPDFSYHFNNMRSYVLGKESGLLMVNFPKTRLTVPFPYFGESMTGFEYTAATHMLYEGLTNEGLACIGNIRQRFDGAKRNPFDEPECGRFYGRSMASWTGILASSGFRYSAVDKTFHVTDKPGTYFWSNGYAWGNFTITKERVTINVLSGSLRLNEIVIKGHEPVRFKDVILSHDLKSSFSSSF